MSALKKRTTIACSADTNKHILILKMEVQMKNQSAKPIKIKQEFLDLINANNKHEQLNDSDKNKVIGNRQGLNIIQLKNLKLLPQTQDNLYASNNVSGNSKTELTQTKKNSIIDNEDAIFKEYEETGEITGTKLVKHFNQETCWLVNKLIPIGATILAGPPKEGKSIFTREMCVDILTGRPFLGEFLTKPCKIFYYAFEESPNSISLQLQNMLINRDINNSDLENLMNNFQLIDGNYLRRKKIKLIDHLTEKLKNHNGSGLAVVDSYVSTLVSKPFKKGSPFVKDYSDMDEYHQLANRLEVGIVIIHHMRKKPSENPLGKISGTQGISAAVAQNLMLTREPGTTKGLLEVIGRLGDRNNFQLSFNTEKVEWEYIGNKIPVELTPERKEIIKIFEADPENEVRSGEIAKILHKSQNTISTTLRRMVKQGVLVDGSKFGFYKLVKETNI